MFIEIKNYIFNSKEIRAIKTMDATVMSIPRDRDVVPAIQIIFIDKSYETIYFSDTQARDEAYDNAVFDLKRIKEWYK